MRRMVQALGVIMLVILAFVAGYAAPDISRDDAKVTCMTLERLTDAALNRHEAKEAAALYQAYEIARGYADEPSIHPADVYMQEAARENPILMTPVTGNSGGFRNHTIDEAAAISNDPDHQTAVIVVPKTGEAQVYHLTLNAGQFEQRLAQQGGVAIGHGIR